MSRRTSRRGAVLVTVLGGVLLLAAIAFAALFVATLDTLAARSAVRSAQDQAALQGALALAAAEALAAPTPGAVLGPWPQHGVAATVALTEPVPGVLRLEATLTDGGRRAGAQLTLSLEPEPAVLWRP